MYGKKGKFIVIEGGEGAGKGVVMADLRQRLADCNDVIFTREPGGTEIAEKIRALLLSKGNEAMLPLTELFLFCGARAQHVNELIKPASESGKNVISDRFDASTIAYQIFGRQRPEYLKTFNQLNGIAKAGIEPDVVVYLDVDPRIGLERKCKSQDGLCSRFDEEKMDFHNRVRAGYLFQYQEAVRNRSNPVWFLIPTTEMKEEEVKDEVWKIVFNLLNSKEVA